ARRLEDLPGGRRQQRVDRAEALREVAAGDVADLLEPDREQEAAERHALRGLDVRDRPPGGYLAEAVQRDELLLGRACEVGRRPHESGRLQLRDLLLAEAVDVHRAA